jgi:hypothetical protein
MPASPLAFSAALSSTAERRGVMGKKKPAMSDDEQDVFRRLKDWAEELDSLMRLYTDRGLMPAERRDEARAMYRNIKEGLRREYQRQNTQRGAAAQTAAERRWYERTVHEAFVRLRAPITASPEKWFDGVYSAYDDFIHTLYQMKDTYDIPKDWLP